jgi:hypothetical protein
MGKLDNNSKEIWYAERDPRVACEIGHYFSQLVLEGVFDENVRNASLSPRSSAH